MRILYNKRKKYFIFGNILKPIRNNRINLFYWKFILSPSNVGDLFSEIIYNYVLSDLFLSKKKKVSTIKNISIIGSIIQNIPNATTIWGSGSLTHYLEKGFTFDVRAVRGPLTKQLLDEKNIFCPTIYGDPAILLPLFYYPKIEKKRDFIIIPHYSVFHLYKGVDNVISTLTDDWKRFINEILSVEWVISSSLHGIILAEAYGIPAILLSDVNHDYFKYDDYYLSTNRKGYKKAFTVEEAIKMGPEELPSNLDFLRLQLCKSFPIDLFEDPDRKSMNDVKSGIMYEFMQR